MGKNRTLEDYYKFAGIDLATKTVHTNFCRLNNIATEDDILNSNEKNHNKTTTQTTKENFGDGSKSSRKILMKYFNIFLSIIVVILILCLFYKVFV